MKIALFHNVAAGGAKRALFEHARHLKARGHTLDAFVPFTACETYLPLQPLCDRFSVYGGAANVADEASPAVAADASFGRSLLQKRTLAFAIDLVRVWRQMRQRRNLEGLYAQMASQIVHGGYDLLYAHQCHFTLAPSLLRLVAGRVPTVFYCQDTLRRATEWAPPEPEDEDERRAGLFLRERRGRALSPVVARWEAFELERFATNLRAADHVLANSWYSREGLLRTTGVNADVCYLGVDTDFFCPDETAAGRDGNVVLSVGALLPTKQHDFVISAVASLPTRNRPRLRIIGYDPAWGRAGQGPFAARLQRLAAKKKVTLTIDKEVTDAVLRDAYRQAAVVAFAPYLEPFGLVALEAMACGTPVVGVSEGGLRETIHDNVTGLLTGRDPAAFGNALARVLGDPPFAGLLGRNGRAAACEKWTWRRSGEALEQVFAGARIAR